MILELTTEKVGTDGAVVSIKGPLTLGTNLKTLDANVQRLIGEGFPNLILDMTECPYCDSAGLGFIVHANGLAGQRGGSIRLCGLVDRVSSMLRMTGVFAILRCDPDRQTSLAHLGSSLPSSS
jgi:anti-sigma B factor antagonist